jgi:arabinofuranosyltransferase
MPSSAINELSDAPSHDRGESVAPQQGAGRSVRTPLLFIAGVFLLHTWYLACVAEDAHITYRYGRNLAEGHGFVWNVGEAPIEGFTTFIWVLVSALSFKLGLSAALLTQVLGIVAALGSLALTYRYARRLLRVERAAALVPAAFLAVAGPLATWAASGMETTAFGFFVLLGVGELAVYAESSSRRALALGTGALMLATLLRPEGTIVFGVAFASVAVSRWLQRSLRPLELVVAASLYALALGSLVLFRYETFGQVVPNTYFAKTGGGSAQWRRGLKYVRYFIQFFGAPLLPLLFLAAWVRPAPAAARGSLMDWLRARAERPALPMFLAVLAVYAAYVVSVGGDYMAMFRFFAPVIALQYLAITPAVARLLAATVDRRQRFLTALAGIACLSATAVHSTPFENSLHAQAPLQHGNHRGVQAERWHVARLRTIGEYFEANKKSDAESLATRSIGVPGYLTRMRIDDMGGLTDAHIARVHNATMGEGWAGHEKADLTYSFSRLPTYVMLSKKFSTRHLEPELTGAPASLVAKELLAAYPSARDFAAWIAKHPDFYEEHYRLRQAWLKDEKNEETGYFVFLERKAPHGAAARSVTAGAAP